MIDYGCGNGEKAELIFKELGLDLHYIAADYSYAMIKKAQEKIENIPHIKAGEHILLDGKGFGLGKEIDQTTYFWL